MKDLISYSDVFVIVAHIQKGRAYLRGQLGELVKLKRKIHEESKPFIEGAEDLLRVKWHGLIDDKGMKADWHRMFVIWLLELSPKDLGQWNKDKTEVTIKRDDYISDLKSRPHYKKCIDFFKLKHNDFSRIKIGDELFDYDKDKKRFQDRPGCYFNFTGDGTTTGEYNIVEWFLGSYLVKMRVISVNLSSRQVHVDVLARNKSHWESATRLPKTFKDIHLPDSVMEKGRKSTKGSFLEDEMEALIAFNKDHPFLVENVEKKGDGKSIGGSFWQNFVWQDVIQY